VALFLPINAAEIPFRIKHESILTMTKSILIVDDNADTRETLAALFNIEGFNVMTAENGHVGFEAAKAGRPDIIITDLNMPEGDGIKMIKQLREQPELSGVPIVAVTGYGDWNAALAIDAGADSTMQKPVEFSTLLQKLGSLLK
jgi:DNA-binding response OmpR family regulator